MNKEHWAGSGHLEALMMSAQGHRVTAPCLFFFTFLFELALLSPLQSQKTGKEREQNISVSK